MSTVRPWWVHTSPTASAGRRSIRRVDPLPRISFSGAESGEFLRQSLLIADRWAPQVKSLLELPSLDHFTVMDAMAERGQPLYEAALGLFEQGP